MPAARASIWVICMLLPYPPPNRFCSCSRPDRLRIARVSPLGHALAHLAELLVAQAQLHLGPHGSVPATRSTKVLPVSRSSCTARFGTSRTFGRVSAMMVAVALMPPRSGASVGSMSSRTLYVTPPVVAGRRAGRNAAHLAGQRRVGQRVDLDLDGLPGPNAGDVDLVDLHVQVEPARVGQLTAGWAGAAWPPSTMATW